MKWIFWWEKDSEYTVFFVPFLRYKKLCSGDIKKEKKGMEVQVVSGFLGAGKTTFLNRYLPTLAGKTVLIENEFGEVGLEG